MDEDIVKKYEVNDILPVILFYQNDNLVARLDGEKTLDEIKSIIEN